MNTRREPSILHLDLDAFFAAVEQRDKPSLRGRPVIVGGLGPRGVVSTASYEARVFGVRSAMPMSEARARCPHAAFLSGRFRAYRAVSEIVMTVLRGLSPRIEPLSLDEAFVDLAAGPPRDVSAAAVRELGAELRADIHRRTAITASVGAATSKLMAKIASEQAKPDGLVVVEPGTELDLLHPLPVRALPGVGPATAARITRLGVKTVGELADVPEAELVALLGDSHGRSLHRLSRGEDSRAVVAERESKSISVEDTFDHDLTDPALLAAIVTRLADRVGARLRAAGLSGRTISVKTRLYDFTTLSRSATLPAPTDDTRSISALAVRLLHEVDTSGGVRLLGVGVSGLSDWVQADLFAPDGLAGADTPPPRDITGGITGAGSEDGNEPTAHVGTSSTAPERTPAARDTPDPLPDALLHGPRRWAPGADVVHAELGPGWVWGSGIGRVTVRFETADTPPGPVRTFAEDDPALAPAPPPSPASE